MRLSRRSPSYQVGFLGVTAQRYSTQEKAAELRRGMVAQVLPANRQLGRPKLFHMLAATTLRRWRRREARSACVSLLCLLGGRRNNMRPPTSPLAAIPWPP